MVTEVEKHLIELCREKFTPFINLPQKNLAERARDTLSSARGHFFKKINKDNEGEITPLVPPPSPTASVNFKKVIAYTALFGVGSYSAFMYWNSSEQSAEYIGEQLQNLFTEIGTALHHVSEISISWAVTFFKFGIANFCVIPTNMVLNSQVLFMLARALGDMINRSPSEKYLTGNNNYVPIILGMLLGVGAEFPFASINKQSAKSFKAIFMAYLTAIMSYPNYFFSSSSVVNSVPSILFSRVKDDSLKHYSKEKRQQLSALRQQWAIKCFQNCTTLFTAYQNMVKTEQHATKQESDESLRAINTAQTNTHFKELLEKRRNALKNLNNEDGDSWKHFLAASDFFEDTDIHTLNNTLCQNIKKYCAQFCKISFVVTPLIIVNIAMIYNDALTAFYSGFDLVENAKLKTAIGSFFGTLSGVASTGFSLSALRNFVQGNSSPEDVVQKTNSKSFLLLAGVLVFFALFSGGPTALEGYQSIMRMLKERTSEKVANEIAITFETLGFIGGDSVNVPFVFFWARWAIHLAAKHLNNEMVRSFLQCIDGYQCLGETLMETKLCHIEAFQNDNTFTHDVGASNESNLSLV